MTIAETNTPREFDETVEPYPTFGHFSAADNEWVINVHGRVVGPRPDNLRKRMIMRVIRRVLKATPEQFDSKTFRERIQGFLMMTRHGRKIRLDMAGHQYTLGKKSKRSGQFQGVVRAAADDLAGENFGEDINPWHWFQVGTGRNGGRFDAPVQLIGAHGPSVISDIDDTIKQSNVLNRRELLANTFFHPFSEIRGMAELYSQWADSGAVFHYVSSSPWQLFEPLSDFVDEAGFPTGSFHLRSIRFRDPSVLQLVIGRKRSKKRAIKKILRSFPSRQFLLIGDSGEKDPEIYGSVARRYRQQISQILVRKIPGSRLNESRMKKAFRGLPRCQWRVFERPEELADLQASRTGWKMSSPSANLT
ncbi:MAG: App1 family protein [Planctomycetota bacterium]